MHHIDLYQAFGLDRTLTCEAIGQHLTSQLESTPAEQAELRDQITTARAILADPHRRALYDQHLANATAPPITPQVLTAMAQQPVVPAETRPAQKARRKKVLAIAGAAIAVLLVMIIGALAIAGTNADTDTNASDCSDIAFVGAAGSGQREGEKLTTYDGMGPLVNDTYQNLLADANDAGVSVKRHVINYPAAPISKALTTEFARSIDAGVTDAAQFIVQTAKACPDTKIVAVGYSQGAMVMHRALHTTGTNGSIVGLLIADGDRIPTDPNVIFEGGAASLPGISYSELGVSASGVESARLFSDQWRGNLLSWCVPGDTVCANTPGKVDFDFGYGALAHTKGYDPNEWRQWLKQKVLS